MAKPYKKPKCFKCGAAMIYIFFRVGDIRDNNIGFYCQTCNSVHINLGIKVIPGSVFVRLKEVR